MFVLSKILGLVGQPVNMAMAALLAGVALLFTRRWRLGRRLAAGGTLLLAVCTIPPAAGWLAGILEDRFPPPRPLPAHVDGIVVLGGSVDPVLSAARDQPVVPAAADRLFAMVALAHRYPDARVVFTGGSGDALHPEAAEAPVVERLLAEMGCDTARVIFEGRSRNTRENALFTRDLVRPRPGEVWLLVTSALHMPRSVGVFRAVGWPVVPYPVDYRTTGQGPDFRAQAGTPALIYAVAHEWEGLAYYRLRGWTDALLPAP